MPRYNFLSCAAKALVPLCSRCCCSNNAEEAEDPSVVELKVKFEDVIECAYDEVEDAETYSPDDLGVGIGLLPFTALGLARTLKRIGSSLR